MDFDMKQNVSVKNRSSGMVIYKIPEHNIRREFSVGEEKQIPYEELVWLSHQPGGRNLMQDMLQIKNPNATSSLNIHTEPEYNMDEEDIIDLLKNGSLDSLLDALDFAPTGVIQMIKDLSVSLPLYDMQKREAILKATGFNVSAAIENAKEDEEDAAEPEAPISKRRVPIAAERYKVVNKPNE